MPHTHPLLIRNVNLAGLVFISGVTCQRVTPEPTLETVPSAAPSPATTELPPDQPFMAGLKIPEGYPARSILDLSFSYGDDPPERDRCLAAIDGETGISVCTGLQGGIFRVAARLPAGSSGTAYLKAVEPIRYLRLSEDTLGQRTRQRVGPSTPEAPVIYYVEDAQIYEGGFHDWYPARFELWLEPEGGAPPGKLLEETFLINGWQR